MKNENIILKMASAIKQSLGIGSKKVNDEREILPLVGDFIALVAEGGREEIKSIAENYIDDKQQNFSGKAYVGQLEKNYVYLELCVMSMCDHFGWFLLGSGKAPKRKDIVDVFSQIRSLTKDEASAHIEFLMSDCKGCSYHDKHERYNSIRQLRFSDIDAYVEELEFGCYFFKACLTLIQGCLDALWSQNDKNFAGVVDFDSQELSLVTYRCLRQITTCVLEDLPINYLVLK